MVKAVGCFYLTGEVEMSNEDKEYINVRFIGNKWIGQVIEVDKCCLCKVTPTKALTILHNQEIDKDHKDWSFTVLTKASDSRYVPKSIEQSVQIALFTNSQEFYIIDSEYLLEFIEQD